MNREQQTEISAIAIALMLAKEMNEKIKSFTKSYMKVNQYYCNCLLEEATSQQLVDQVLLLSHSIHDSSLSENKQKRICVTS